MGFVTGVLGRVARGIGLSERPVSHAPVPPGNRLAEVPELWVGHLLSPYLLYF